VSQPSALPALLDTNVPMYAAGAAHPYRDACQWIMSQTADGLLLAAIDVEVIQEILYRYGALGRYADAVAIATDLLALVPNVYPVTPADVQTAVALYQQYAPHGVRSRDVIHAAVMLNNGISEIISADSHFDLIVGIRRADPIALYQQARGQSS
jgi:predicted nucleic acid-binding protein